MKRNKIIGYSDGACKGNPGPGGWGAFISYTSRKGNLEWQNLDFGGKKKTTNQEMELYGALKLLHLCPSTASNDIILRLDSKYVLGGLISGGVKGNLSKGDQVFTGWISGWLKNNWKNGEVKYIDVWKDIMAICEYHLSLGSTIQFEWVKGHSGEEGNELADTLANFGIPK
jgi:ribonuclease HI